METIYQTARFICQKPASNLYSNRLQTSDLAGDCVIYKTCKLEFIEMESVMVAWRT
jgi:hypothetical protein